MTDLQWFLNCHEPWTRYRTRLDLIDAGQQDAAVQSDRAEMLAHPQVQALMRTAAEWPGYALNRHNDAKHPMVVCGMLLDFGFRADDPGIKPVVDAILARPSAEVRLNPGFLSPRPLVARIESNGHGWHVMRRPCLPSFLVWGQGLNQTCSVPRQEGISWTGMGDVLAEFSSRIDIQ